MDAIIGAGGIAKSDDGLIDLVTKGKPKSDLEEELADVLILILGHALAMEVDLERSFHDKMDRIMQRPSRQGGLGVRVTEFVGES